MRAGSVCFVPVCSNGGGFCSICSKCSKIETCRMLQNAGVVGFGGGVWARCKCLFFKEREREYYIYLYIEREVEGEKRACSTNTRKVYITPKVNLRGTSIYNEINDACCSPSPCFPDHTILEHWNIGTKPCFYFANHKLALFQPKNSLGTNGTNVLEQIFSAAC